MLILAIIVTEKASNCMCELMLNSLQVTSCTEARIEPLSLSYFEADTDYTPGCPQIVSNPL